MSESFPARIDHRSAWKGSDFSGPRDVAIRLEERHLDALRSVVARARKAGVGLQELAREHTAMPEIEADLHEIRHELMEGRGLVILQGWPIEEMSVEELGIAYWAVGTYFGRGVSQSPMGDRLGYVTDVSKPGTRERGYRSAQELSLHTDSDDIVGLLSIRRGRSGGLSRLASSLAVFNEMVRDHPDLLPPLLEGFFCQVGAGEPDSPARVTAMKVPVFSLVDGDFACCFLRSRMELALATLGRDFTPLERRALDTFEAIANRPDMCLSFMLEPGTASFINNHTTLHARTAFEDFEEAEKKRLLLRLWLRAEPGRRLAEGIARYYGPDGGYEPVAAQ